MRRALLCTIPSLALAIAACAPGGDGDDRSGPPIGYELASAAELEAREALGQTGSEIAERESNLVEIDAEELAEKLEAGNVRLIDVRRDDEVALGMIPGAEHIAMDAFDPAALDMSDGREIVLYCRSGRRSALVGERLAAFTGEPVTHLAGGILAWQASGQASDKPAE